MIPVDTKWCDSVVVAGSHPSKYSTWNLVCDLLDRGVQGDFCEAGVMAGGQCAVMGRVLDLYKDNRRIHLFDSFEGIPQATRDDSDLNQRTYGLRNGPEMFSSGISHVDLSGVQYFLRSWGVSMERMVFHPGWFQHVMGTEAQRIGKLALLRLDVDLYESTQFCLEYLYDKVVPGGIIIDDDFGYDEPLPACRRALFEFLDARGIKRPDFSLVDGNPGTVWWVKE